MLENFGRFTYRWRGYVIGLWICVVLVAATFAPRVTGILRGGGYSIGNSQSVAAYNQLHASFGYSALIFNAVFTSERAPRSQLLVAAQAFRREALQRFPGALSIRQPVWTPDHAAAFIRIYSAPQDDLGAHFAAPLQRLLPKGPIRGYLAGPSAIFHDMEVVSDQDLQRVELVTLPVAAVFLLLIFGSVVAAATPVLMAPVAVTMALAMIYFIGHRVDMSIFVLNTASMLGLGIAIDYSLFMVNRFREELEQGKDLEDAVGRTVATAGRSILVSALVVSVGFFGLTLSGVQMLRSLGIGGSIVTAFSLLVAVSLLPAILGVIGHRINLLPVLPRRLATRQVWRAIATRVMRWPVAIIGAVAVMILLLAFPAFHLRTGIPGAEILPTSVDSRAGNDVLNHHLGYANQSPVLVVVQRHGKSSVPVQTSVPFAVIDRICSAPQVVGLSTQPVVDSPSQIISCRKPVDTILNALQRSARGVIAAAPASQSTTHTGLLAVFLRTDPSSAASERFVSALRVQPAIPGYTVLVGGQTAGQMDFNSFLYARFPLVVLFVIVTIYVVLLIAFRSVLLPLKAVLMNVFSVLAAYGVVVFAFQDGHLADILGFTVVGNIDSIVPILLFCVLFGISTDYEVFLLSRIQEQYLVSHNNEESVAAGLEATGRIITSAAVVMIVVFGAFAFARLVVIKEVGLGLALAVLVDATLIRALLVPATMRLLGRWNWWLPLRGFPARTDQKSKPLASKSTAAG